MRKRTDDRDIVANLYKDTSDGLQMRNLALFFHIWSPPQTAIARLLVDEQLKRIARSSLPNVCDVYCCVSGDDQACMAEFVGNYSWIAGIKSAGNDKSYELPTLNWLYQQCKSKQELRAVGYIHTKGVSNFVKPNATRELKAVNSWRHFLEWGTLDRWRDALILLQNYDVVGVNYKDQPWPHMSGNFWWAKPDYLRGLVAPDLTPVDDQWPINGDPRSRHLYEKWIGSGRPNAFSFYSPPFCDDGVLLGCQGDGDLNLYIDDIEPYYRRNSY